MNAGSDLAKQQAVDFNLRRPAFNDNWELDSFHDLALKCAFTVRNVTETSIQMFKKSSSPL